MTTTHKVLMIHGYRQSADIFKPKTRYVREVFRNLPGDIDFQFEYISGVFPAYPDDDTREYHRVWGYGEPENDPIRGIQTSIQYILDVLDEKGPFSGVVGFSSGAAMAAITTSLLEKRKPIGNYAWKTQHSQLRFAVYLSGFRLGDTCYNNLYLPKISTPVFHTSGELDAMVSPSQTRSLVDHCENPWLYEFWGGHDIPQNKECVGFRISFGDFLQQAMEISPIAEGTWVDI